MTCAYPTVKFIAYEDRFGGKIFVPDPTLRGRYIYTDRCVALVACPMCKSIPGEPCKRHYETYGNNGITYHTSTHAVRRQAVDRRKLQHVTDIAKEHIDLPLELTEADL